MLPLENKEKQKRIEKMTEKEVVTLLLENGGKEKSGVDVKIQYNKRDITAIFRKSACEKLGVKSIKSLRFENVKTLQKALEKITEKSGVTLTVA